MTVLSTRPVILASASAARREMLEAAGLDVRCRPVAVDEEEIRRALAADRASAAEAAATLAEHKAVRAASQLGSEAARVPIIGADQILDCNGIWFAKPPDRDHARAQLLSLRGKTHTLVSGVCVVRDGSAVWHHVSEARLRMRPFSDGFADLYLDAMGDRALATVGGYELEGLGSHLFDRVDGDWFTILGMPLLPLLDHLRLTGILPA
ncbi:MAG: nucleoside triphosphate pyrophosphatase [Acetobacterales bacterium]